jgi:hypothetical protein
MIIAYSSNCYFLYRFTPRIQRALPCTSDIGYFISNREAPKSRKPENLMCLVHTSVLERQPHSLPKAKKIKSLSSVNNSYSVFFEVMQEY